MKRGLTLIELLVALSLLSLIVLASSAWIRITAGSAAQESTLVHQSTAAQAVLRLIHSDLITGDFNRAENADPRVRIEGNRLQIDTRVPETGLITHSYRYDPSSGHLLREAHSPHTLQSPRPLLEGVTNWTCTLAEDDSLLTVALTFADKKITQQSFTIP